MLTKTRTNFALLILVSVLLAAGISHACAALLSEPHSSPDCTARQIAYEAALFADSASDAPFLMAPDGYTFDTSGCLIPVPAKTILLADRSETPNRRGGSMPAPPKP